MNKWIRVVLILVAVLGIYLFTSPSNVTPVTQAPQGVDYAASATGNPDDMVNAYLQQANAEQAIVGNEFGDTAALDTDSSEMDGLGQAYNENQL